MNVKLTVFFVIFMLMTSSMFSQSAKKKIDSLMQVAETSNDSVRLRIYNQVSFYYIFNEPDKAKDLLIKGIDQARAKQVPFSEAELVNTYGIYYDVTGNSDSAKYYFEKALNLSETHNFKVIAIMTINNLGMFHWNKGNYQEAMDYFFQALEMNKKNSTDSADGTYFNNIGLIYQEMGQYDKALIYHEKALEVRQRHQQKNEIPTSLSNIAVILGEQGNYEASENTFLRAITLAQEENELGKYFDALSGLSDIYIEQDQFRKAIPLLEELLKGRNENNIDRRSNLIAISHLIKAYNNTGNLSAALKYIAMGNSFIEEFPDVKNATVLFYQHASETYFRSNDAKKGAEYLDRAIVTKEAIFSADNASAIASLETKYNILANERALAETRADLAEKELEVEQKNTLIYGTLGLAIFLGIFVILVYRHQKLKNSQLQKEAELKTALAKIETQNQLQEQRLRISRDLHDNIGSQLTFIISSIDNLKFGLSGEGNKVTEKLSNISKFTSQTIYELRDTIWAMNKTHISVDDLQARISNYIEKARVSSEVDFQFEFDNNLLNDSQFTSVQGMNIYRVIQEAVNNALKYSEAAVVHVRFAKVETARGEKTEVAIIDNGKGFDMDKANFGNGLNNIKKRAKDLGGEISITSKKDAGTEVRMIF